jgi:DNA repair photolyase
MISEIHSKSVLRKHKKIDSWFLTHYGMNLYRGCRHNCVYCDGRHEKYQVDGEFGEDIAVKINAPAILDRELDPARKRKPMPQSFILLGGGVCDTYQPAEEKYRITRSALKLVEKYDYPVHILTKSTLVERDLDILKRINDKKKAIVSFSFSSTDKKISHIFEPGVPFPIQRLKAMEKIREAGLSCGIFLMPIIPFITDNPSIILKSLQDTRDAGAEFVIFGTMTLKEGRQKDYFKKILNKKYPGLALEYEMLYPAQHKWGEALHKYINSVNRIFDDSTSKLNIPKRMPPHIYRDHISLSDRIIVMLEHLDYLNMLKQRKTPYGYAAYNLSKAGVPIEEMGSGLSSVKGAGKAVRAIIKEIIETGTSSQYEVMLYGK